MTGDRDSIQLVTEDSTVLYTMRGVSELARLTPAAVQEKYGVPPHRYPELAAIVGETSDNLPGVPGVGQGYAAKWINQFDGLDNVIARADEITGKKGEALRAHLGDVIRNRQLNALVRDLTLPVRPDGLARQPWDRTAGLELLDELEFRGELRSRLLDTIDPDPADAVEAEAGFELDGRRLGAGEAASWLDEHAPAGTRVGVSVQGSWRAGTGEVLSVAVATREGQAAWLDVAERRRGRRRCRRGLAGRPGAPQGDPRRQGAQAGAGRARLGARRPRGRHRSRGLPRPARPALLRPRRPDPALPQARAAPGHRRRRPAQLRRDGRHDGQRHRDADRAGRPRPRRRARRRGGGARWHPPAARGRAPAHRHPRPHGAGGHRGRHRLPRGAGVGVQRPGARCGDRRLRRHRQGDQPRLAQAAAGGAVRRARHAEDQAHQDRLHHRRRRPAAALREDRAPVPAAPAAPPRRDPAAPDRRGPAQDRRLRRPHPHDLQPDHRCDGPALEHRPQPAEHPDPHRGRSPHPRGLRRRRGPASR